VIEAMTKNPFKPTDLAFSKRLSRDIPQTLPESCKEPVVSYFTQLLFRTIAPPGIPGENAEISTSPEHLFQGSINYCDNGRSNHNLKGSPGENQGQGIKKVKAGAENKSMIPSQAGP